MSSSSTISRPPRRCAAARGCRRNERPSGGQYFENVPVRVLEIDATSAVPVIDLHVGARARAAAVGDAFVLDPGEDRVELGFADPERVMMVLEIAALVEIEGQLLVDLDRCEMGMRAFVFEAKDPRKELGRRDLVVGRDDGVIEDDCHEPPPAGWQEMGTDTTPRIAPFRPGPNRLFPRRYQRRLRLPHLRPPNQR